LSQLVLQALIELNALAPRERMGLMRVVGRDESQNVLGGGVKLAPLTACQALLAQDRKPDLNEREPGAVDRQPMKHEAPGTVGNIDRHFRRVMEPYRIENEMDHLLLGDQMIEEAQEFDEL